MNYEQLEAKIATQWSDAYPVLLLPVKVQVRFMTCMHLAQVQELSHIARAQSVATAISAETQTALDELAQQLQAAADAPQQVLLPTHELVAGDNRHFPAPGFAKVPDTKELWVRFYPDDVHLHTHEAPLTQDEYDSGLDFWREMNTAAGIAEADTQKAAQVGAWRVLASGYGNARAAWIASSTRPLNFQEAGMTIGMELDFPPYTGDATISTWNVAPHTKVLPEHFVVKTFRETEEVVEGVPQKTVHTQEYVGKAIPDELQLSIDPQTDSQAFQETHEGLEMPEAMQWLVDFTAAEATGMAIRIPLSTEEATHGFDKILVLGVKANKQQDATQDLIDELFVNHHYKPGGMSIIPQGTPTNNTEEDNSGRGLDDLDAAESFDLAFGKDTFTPTDDHKRKPDGQRLAEALGTPHEHFQSVYHNTGQDIAQSIKVNEVLWNASLGYSLPQYLYPLIRQAEVDYTCRFMVNYALARGFLPAIRIDDQPYGILVTTDYARFAAADDDPFAAFIQQLNQQLLQKLDTIWTDLRQQVARLDKNTTADELADTFYKVLELHASSVTYDQQLVIGENIAQKLETETGTPVINDTAQIAGIRQQFNHLLGFDLQASPLAFSYLQGNVKVGVIEKNEFAPGQLVDGLPDAASDTIEALVGTEKNYIEWLGALDTNFDRLLAEDFSNFTDVPLSEPPRSLFYNMLRYSLIRHYMLTAMRIKYRDNPTLAEVLSVDFEENILWVETAAGDPSQITSVHLNKQFRDIILNFYRKDRIHDFWQEAFAQFPGTDQDNERADFVQTQIQNTDLDQQALQTLQELINTGTIARDLYEDDKLKVLEADIVVNGDTLKIKEYIDQQLQLPDQPDARALREHKLFLQDLARLTNVELERLFNEHLDSCHYRLDAWMSGLANYRLDQMRKNHSRGTFLGAYGYLENVHPRLAAPGICIKVVDAPAMAVSSATAVVPVFPFAAVPHSTLSEGDLITKAFLYLGDPQPFDRIAYDEAVGKIMSVPQEDASNQGYVPTPSLVHAVTAAVLRSAHTAHQESGTATDTFAVNLSSSRVREAMYLLEGMENGQEIGALLGYKFERYLRETDPLLTQYIYEFRDKYPFRVQDIDKPAQAEGTDELDNRIVIDAKRMLKDYRQGADFDDFLNGLVPALSPQQKEHIRSGAARLETSLDAINDLLVAESFYQIAAGNPDRSRAALKMLNEGGAIQMPEIVQIPRSGISLTHRVGVMLPTRSMPTEWGGPLTPRAVLDTRVNRYLRSKLPDASKIVVRVRWQNGMLDSGEPDYQFANIPLSKLLIQPVDLVYMYYQQRNTQNESELRYRLNAFVRKTKNLKADQFVEVLERDRTDFKANQVHLFALDPLLLGLAEQVLGARYLKPADLMLPTDPLLGEANTRLDWAELNGRLNTVYQLAKKEHDQLVERTALLKSIFGLEQEQIDTEVSIIRTLLKRVRENLLFFTELGIGNALPPLDYSITKNNVERIYLQANACLKSMQKRLQKLAGLGIMRPDELVQPDGRKRAIRFSDIDEWVIQPLKTRPRGAALAHLSSEELVELLLEVITILMGESYKAFPGFKVANPTELNQAYDHDALLDFAGPYAVEEWLQSLAPVRPQMHAYLKVNMLSEMFELSGSDSQLLKPIQLPFHAGGHDRWLGMEYPPEYAEVDIETNTRKISEDTLSLVFEYNDDFNTSKSYAGFVLDEWNEIIPEPEVNTGVAMHYDQANNEAPNTILLAVPAHPSGQWQLDELFQTIEATMAFAKKRTVDPDLLKTTYLNQFLPAVLAAIKQENTAPSLDFGRLIAQVTPGANGFAVQRFSANAPVAVPSMDVSDLGIAEVFDEEDL